MKTWGILLLILLTANMAFAAEIQAPEKVVSYAPFTFRVVMPATDTFTQSAVHFDNILIATIYPSGTCVVQQDWIPFIIHCAGGYRSMIASSMLKQRGWDNFVDVKNGFDAISKTSVPVTEYVCPTTLL